jgi:subtilisin family serine protease
MVTEVDPRSKREGRRVSRRVAAGSDRRVLQDPTSSRAGQFGGLHLGNRQPAADTGPSGFGGTEPERDTVDLATRSWGVIAAGARQSAYTGAGITVGILDTGIAAAHEAFAGLEIVARNFTGDPKTDAQALGHGTGCASIIRGRSVNGQWIGLAPGVQRLIVAKVFGETGGGPAPS